VEVHLWIAPSDDGAPQETTNAVNAAGSAVGVFPPDGKQALIDAIAQLDELDAIGAQIASATTFEELRTAVLALQAKVHRHAHGLRVAMPGAFGLFTQTY
jgi:hypothetical protein